MGPVSAFGFSVCGWVRFEARGWRGRGGDRLGHPRQCAGAGCWGWGHAGQGKAVTSAGRAVMDKGSKGKSQGHPPYLPYLPMGITAEHGKQGQAWAWVTLPGRQGSRGLAAVHRWWWLRGGGLGPGRRQGTKDGLSREDQEQLEVHFRLVPGGEDKGARGGHPHDGHHHWPVCPLLPPEPSRPSRTARTSPTFRAA